MRPEASSRTGSLRGDTEAHPAPPGPALCIRPARPRLISPLGGRRFSWTDSMHIPAWQGTGRRVLGSPDGIVGRRKTGCWWNTPPHPPHSVLQGFKDKEDAATDGDGRGWPPHDSGTRQWASVSQGRFW